MRAEHGYEITHFNTVLIYYGNVGMPQDYIRVQHALVSPILASFAFNPFRLQTCYAAQQFPCYLCEY